MSDEQRAAAVVLVDNMITNNRIAVFSKSYCPYCRKAKMLLADRYSDVPANIIELDERSDGRVIQDYLEEKTGQVTVPNIFIGTRHIGGSSDLAELEDSKKLEPLIYKM